ncbi:MAG: PDZ domain-containing protein [Acidobacteriaceae bacterium]|nr:PDZ domain-containing protein [Acidobacteriaceae bacterium]
MKGFHLRRSLVTATLLGGSVFGASAFAQSNFAQLQFAQLNQDPDLWNFQNQGRLLSSQFRTGGSYLGVQLSDIDSDRAATLSLGEPRGVEITAVEPGSPAEQAGLKPGDVLLSYNGENILGAQQLGRLVSETPIGRKIRIQYWRQGKTESTVVTTAAYQPRIVGIPPASVNMRRFDFPDFRNFEISDIPTPLLAWKNSMLGIECEPLDTQLAQYFGVKSGVLVRSVDKGGPGGKAGVKAGDVITSLGDHGISNPRDFTAYTRTERQPVRNLSVELVRDHKNLRLSVAVNETP